MWTTFQLERWREQSRWVVTSLVSQCHCTPQSGMDQVGPQMVGNTESITNMLPTSPNSPTSYSTAARSIPSSSSPSATTRRNRNPSPPASRGRKESKWRASGRSTWHIPIAMTNLDTAFLLRSAWSTLRRLRDSEHSTPSHSGTGGATTGNTVITGAGRKQRPRRFEKTNETPPTTTTYYCSRAYVFVLNDSGGSVSFVFVYRERESADLLRVIIEFLYGMCIVHTFLLDFHVILIYHSSCWCCLCLFYGLNFVMISVFSYTLMGSINYCSLLFSNIFF